ncbi:RHS repeat-associated core domain-containing protein [Streptosporangium sp. NPDC004379]|uniref:RHS repeat-associated core domain-containing protein n=1 Tax=Streptosporangium sp. NPDC004379 TaxID=3366189 RepID=UPI0036772DCD
MDFAWDGFLLAEEIRGTGWNGAETGPTGLEATVWEYEPGTFRPVTQVRRTRTGDAVQGRFEARFPAGDAVQGWSDERFRAVVTDPAGAPAELAGPGGTVTWRARPTLWGEHPDEPAGSAECPLRLPGQYADPESGLHHNHHRHYDPETARYASADPLGLLSHPNPYAYVHNPLGLMGCTPDVPENEKLLYGPFHRIMTPNQEPDFLQRVLDSGELWGRSPRYSSFPQVQAYAGPLPASERHKRGSFTFYTEVRPDRGSRLDRPTWGGEGHDAARGTTGNRPGVYVDDEWAKIKIHVTDYVP